MKEEQHEAQNLMWENVNEISSIAFSVAFTILHNKFHSQSPHNLDRAKFSHVFSSLLFLFSISTELVSESHSLLSVDCCLFVDLFCFNARFSPSFHPPHRRTYDIIRLCSDEIFSLLSTMNIRNSQHQTFFQAFLVYRLETPNNTINKSFSFFSPSSFAPLRIPLTLGTSCACEKQMLRIFPSFFSRS